eukprot:15344462-Ditylum_brightwellii.AAC.1
MHHTNARHKPIPAHFLLPDWDVQIEITQALDLIGATLYTKHVYDHQDAQTIANYMTGKKHCRKQTTPKKKKRKRKRKNPSWEATLNITADKPATQEYLDINKTRSNLENVEMLPLAHTYLYIGDTPILGKYKSTINYE